MAKKKKVSTKGFAVGFLVVLLAAWLFPEPGATGGALHSEVTIRLAVMLIFVIQGIRLPSENFKTDLLNWRLHLFVQVFGYCFIPLMVILLDALLGDFLHPDLRLGFLYLAVLPSTISTAIIFSGLAGGNMAGAIFNTALSNVLGVFLVPVWCLVLLASSVAALPPIGPLFLNIAILLVLPLIFGQALRPWLKHRADRHKKLVVRMNAGLVYFIFYAVSCNSILDGPWRDGGIELASTAIGLSLILLFLVKAIAWMGGGLCGLDRGNRITAFFCGSQKTLAAGVAMASSIFIESPESAETGSIDMGVLLLPLICYHFLQLIVGGFLVDFLKNPSDNGE